MPGRHLGNIARHSIQMQRETVYTHPVERLSQATCGFVHLEPSRKPQTLRSLQPYVDHCLGGGVFPPVLRIFLCSSSIQPSMAVPLCAHQDYVIPPDSRARSRGIHAQTKPFRCRGGFCLRPSFPSPNSRTPCHSIAFCLTHKEFPPNNLRKHAVAPRAPR